jgi:hypothetical protein
MISTLENPIIVFRLVIASDDGTSQRDEIPTSRQLSLTKSSDTGLVSTLSDSDRSLVAHDTHCIFHHRRIPSRDTLLPDFTDDDVLQESAQDNLSLRVSSPSHSPAMMETPSLSQLCMDTTVNHYTTTTDTPREHHRAVRDKHPSRL